MRTILFLDIDGVLNSTRYWWINQPLPMNQAGAIDPEAVARLNRIVEATGASVVLSSSWRGAQPDGYQRVQAMLVERGFTGALIGQTELLWCDRHLEIAKWLNDHAGEWDRFVVIDDDPDAWIEDGPFADRGLFASTNYLHGLVDEHVPLILAFCGAPVAAGGAS